MQIPIALQVLVLFIIFSATSGKPNGDPNGDPRVYNGFSLGIPALNLLQGNQGGNIFGSRHVSTKILYKTTGTVTVTNFKTCTMTPAGAFMPCVSSQRRKRQGGKDIENEIADDVIVPTPVINLIIGSTTISDQNEVNEYLAVHPQENQQEDVSQTTPESQDVEIHSRTDSPVVEEEIEVESRTEVVEVRTEEGVFAKTDSPVEKRGRSDIEDLTTILYPSHDAAEEEAGSATEKTPLEDEIYPRVNEETNETTPRDNSVRSDDEHEDTTGIVREDSEDATTPFADSDYEAAEEKARVAQLGGGFGGGGLGGLLGGKQSVTTITISKVNIQTVTGSGMSATLTVNYMGCSPSSLPVTGVSRCGP